MLNRFVRCVLITLAAASLGNAQREGPIQPRPRPERPPETRPAPQQPAPEQRSPERAPGERPSAQGAETVAFGTIVKLEPERLEIEKAPGQPAQFQITTSTQFEPAAGRLAPGDIVRIRAERLGEGEFTALSVEFAGDPESRSADASPGGVPPSSEDPGPPVLVRRKPGDDSPVRRHDPGDLPEREAPPEPRPDPAPEPEPSAPPPLHDDPLIDKAMRANLRFIENLPNFTCQQSVRRLESRNLGRDWKKLDEVEAEVVYVDRQEHYRNITVNGRPAGDDMKEIGGQWSTGEYGTMLRNIFHPRAGVEFEPGETDRMDGRETRIYHYSVPGERSRWNVGVGDKQIRPAHKGRVWIDPETGRALRVEMEALNLPHNYPLSHLEAALQLGTVTISGEPRLLPVESANLSCFRSSAVCTKNIIEFRGYQKFTASSAVFHTDSDIEFGEDEQDGQSEQAPEDATGAPR